MSKKQKNSATTTQKPSRSPLAGFTREEEDHSVDSRLVPGEKIVASAVIHPGIYWKAAAVFLLAVFFALFVVVELGVLLAATAVALAFYATVKKEILSLVITDKRVFARYGILQIDLVDIHFDKIESIELERMLPGYVMGYANVIIMGTGNRYIVIPYVGNAMKMRRAYNEQVLAAKENTTQVSDKKQEKSS